MAETGLSINTPERQSDSLRGVVNKSKPINTGRKMKTRVQKVTGESSGQLSQVPRLFGRLLWGGFMMAVVVWLYPARAERRPEAGSVAALSGLKEVARVTRDVHSIAHIQAGNSTNLDDYRWGKLHRIVLAHQLGGPFNIPPASGVFPSPLPGLAGIPVDGGFGTVDAGLHHIRGDTADAFMFDHGAGMRFVSEAGPGGVRAVSSLPGGVSGVPGSPHYADLLPGWLTNEAFQLLFKNSDVRKNAESFTVFVPSE